MAFMGRGEIPSLGDLDSDNNGNNYHGGPYIYNRFCYYIPLDNTYVSMQIIVTFIILIIGVITYLATYKSDIIDPIENVKKLFINTHLAIIVITLVITLIINLFSKKESDLLRRLVLLFTISIVTMFVIFGVKLNMDTTYTRDRFARFLHRGKCF